MTNDEIRIKVAEACGWKINPAKHTAKILDWIHTESECTGYFPPNYPEDLNACADFEKTISPDQQNQYIMELGKVCCVRGFNIVTATARQRCLAFLKTKGILP